MQIEEALVAIQKDLGGFLGDFMAELCWQAQAKNAGIDPDDLGSVEAEQYHDLLSRLDTVVLAHFLGAKKARAWKLRWAHAIRDHDADEDYPVV